VFEPDGPGHYWDLVPSRVLRAEVNRGASYVGAQQDAEWHTEAMLDLELKASRPEATKAAIRYEHGIVGNKLQIGPVRKALRHYVRAEYVDRRYYGLSDAVWEETTSPERGPQSKT
jgi:hypothetical protein